MIKAGSEIVLYEYYGLTLYFDTQDRLPLRLYSRLGAQKCMAEIGFDNGIYTGCSLFTVQGFEGLDEEDRQRTTALVETFLPEIVKNWTDVFIYRKEIQSEVITRKIG
ncbi:MAG: hypothetical protein JNL57_09560 [Bacteroidetes bacterium]|nr:hypothetical protein [Bacteroidota bacterium]